VVELPIQHLQVPPLVCMCLAAMVEPEIPREETSSSLPLAAVKPWAFAPNPFAAWSMSEKRYSVS
jgi:hypothetical protein